MPFLTRGALLVLFPTIFTNILNVSELVDVLVNLNVLSLLKRKSSKFFITGKPLLILITEKYCIMEACFSRLKRD